ncbi:MAG: nucleoside hydrolase [Reichenbachiella sp.]
MRILASLLLILGFTMSFGTMDLKSQPVSVTKKLPVIFDTDANNELDDQHALAYLFSNRDYFDIKAVTVNATRNGGDIEGHFDEAERIMQLFNVTEDIPLLKGANKSFINIKDDLSNPAFDGFKAVNFIISEAKKHTNEKLVIIAVGKLTNLALALKKEPIIAANIRLVWLGANYPDPGEYNLEDDIASMNYVLKTNIDFEMVTVRYEKPSGTSAVRVTQKDINSKMPGLGPTIANPIIGRHGGNFNNFGDYSVNLFTHIDYYGDPPSRALFDMAAVAIIKNPIWAESSTIPCPTMIDQNWVDQPNNPRIITIWENFEKEKIIADFFNSLSGY